MFYDLGTKNISFSHAARMLKEAGIKNYKFPLQVNREELIGADPYSLNDRNDPKGVLRRMVQQEASENIWYYFRECVRIPVPGAILFPKLSDIKTTHFQLNLASMFVIWMTPLNALTYSMTPRQSGTSTLFSLLAFWLGINSSGFGAQKPLVMFPNQKLWATQSTQYRLLSRLVPEYFNIREWGNDASVGFRFPFTDKKQVEKYFGDKTSSMPLLIKNAEYDPNFEDEMIIYLRNRKCGNPSPAHIQTNGIVGGTSGSQDCLYWALARDEHNIFSDGLLEWSLEHYDLYTTTARIDPNVCYFNRTTYTQLYSQERLDQMIKLGNLSPETVARDYMCEIK